MDIPKTRFARIGDERIAYQVHGEGPDLIYFSGMVSDVDVRWEDPTFASFLRRLGSFSRLIAFDRRGTGVSDTLPPGQQPTWETFVDDVRAIMDDIGSERATIFAVLDAGPTAILFATSHPERTSGLILVNTAARLVEDDGYPNGLPRAAVDALISAMESMWGTEEMSAMLLPSRANDAAFMRWYAKFQRASTRPRDAIAYLRTVVDLDVRDALPALRAPTLILHATDNPLVPLAHGRFLADAIEGSRLVEIEGSDAVVWLGNVDRVLAEIEEFVTGSPPIPEPDRVLATVLFTDIVGSTERAASMGDQRWRDVLASHAEIAASSIATFRGTLVKTMGDGVLATFDGPARALRCASDMRARLKGLGLEMRMGLHTGEIELLGDDVGGIAINIGARVMAEAGPNEIITTSTVRDLVVGSQIVFADRGACVLKGVPGEWRLFEATV